MQIPIANVEANPFRNFHIYPYDKEQLESLKGSIQELSLYQSLPARQWIIGNTTHQIAAGHHRLEAMKQLGMTHVELQVMNLSDDHMIQIMTTENALQRGKNSAALMDSVAAIMERLSYYLLKYDWEEFQNVPRNLGTFLPFPNKAAFSNNLTRVKNGTGIGREAIIKYAPAGALTTTEIDESIRTIKASGMDRQILLKIQQSIAFETKQEEEKLSAQKAEIEKQRVAAERRAEAARKQEIKAAKIREQREREAAEAAAIAEQKRAQLDAEAAARRKAELDKIASEEKARQDAAQQAAENAINGLDYKKDSETGGLVENTPDLDLNAAQLFKRTNHAKEFRTRVQQYKIPVSEQLELAQKIIDKYQDTLSSRNIFSYISEDNFRQNIANKKRTAQEIRAEEERNARFKERNLLNAIDSDIARLHTSLSRMQDFYEDNKALTGYGQMSIISMNLVTLRNFVVKLIDEFSPLTGIK